VGHVAAPLARRRAPNRTSLLSNTTFSEPTRLVLVRHGVTAWNLELRIQGQLDIALSPTGVLQAQRAAQALAAEGIEHIYSSDLQRAHATALAIAARTAAPLTVDTGLRERAFGQYEGLTHAEIEQRWPADAQRWRSREPGFTPAGGETLELFYERSVRCAAALAARHPGQTVALVAHGGVLDCLYRAATGQALYARRTWELANATINRVLWHGEGFSLVGWNDAAHLEGLPAAA
jgi:2,3-bisphosphoglycerate-dependent phosphoglycerate mutase